MQSDQGLHCPQTEPLDTIECFNVQDDVNLRILFMFKFKGTFSLDVAQIYFSNSCTKTYIMGTYETILMSTYSIFLCKNKKNKTQKKT